MTRKIRSLMIAAVIVLSLILTACDDDFKEVGEPAARNENAGFVSVSDVDELLAAIKPDAKLLLKPGNYELSSAESYGIEDGEYYEWRTTYDGNELILTDVDGLVIKGEDDDGVRITSRSTYANVLTIKNSADVTLENLTVGHLAKPGTCSGGVLALESISDSRIEDCELYGCGVVGVDALKCKRLVVNDCEIYECSAIAVNADSSTDIRVTDCDIHDCGGEYGGSVFWMTGTTGFAVVDCEIERNSVNYLMYASYCPETYILGCETKDNTIRDAVFWLAGSAPKIEGTELHNNAFTAWYDSTYSPTPGLRCTDRAGNELTNSQLENMKEAECSFNGPVIPEVTAQPETVKNKDGTKTVYVRTADEFLTAIAPDTSIRLDSEEINLADASNYGSGSSEFYRWEACYDGPQLVIEHCDNLSITSEIMTCITAEPRYANVLTFENCSDVWLSGFKAGHTEEPGFCTGGVIYMNTCKNMAVDGCRLYGCGTLGVEADYVEGLSVTGCEIYDCTLGGIVLYETRNAVMENCDIHDCAKPAITVFECSGVSFVNADGKGKYLDDGLYNIEKGLPYIWDWESEIHEEVEPSLDFPSIEINAENIASEKLLLGENDGSTLLTAYVSMPNAESVNTNQIIWVCEDDGMLELDPYVGQSVNVTSHLKPGESTKLYVYYLENGSVLASDSIYIYCSRP
ncbi:MAG: right-handed parallel beta-helix repeat-containing protein [Eubacteriales bacterium]|nr:right-handed parallel beta-helix repeat-containing protein [Eubacteriales bacterium]